MKKRRSLQLSKRANYYQLLFHPAKIYEQQRSENMEIDLLKTLYRDGGFQRPFADCHIIQLSRTRRITTP